MRFRAGRRASDYIAAVTQADRLLQRRAWRAWGALAATAALLAAGCGDGDGDGDEPADGAVPSTGVEAAPPEQASSCLEKAGYTVSTTSEAQRDSNDASGIEVRLLVLTADSASTGTGAGAITYYASEEQAFEAHQAELGSQEPDSVVGRVGAALYSFAGEDFSAGGQAILRCL